MSRFYQFSNNTILNLDNVLYIRKNKTFANMKLQEEIPCIDVIYGTNECKVQYTFDDEIERDKHFNELASYLKAVEDDLR